MTSLMRALIPVVLAVSSVLTTAAVAQGTPAPVDAEERLDEGLKGFGYLAGLARVCVAGTQQSDLEREVLDLNGSIARLLGTDRAFLFSTAFGYGTSIKVEQKDCAEILKNYEARVTKHRAAARSGK